jgi:hypothetical protein
MCEEIKTYLELNIFILKRLDVETYRRYGRHHFSNLKSIENSRLSPNGF